MRTTAKICGLSTPATLDSAIASGASHVGFVHFAPSPRHVDLARLAGLAARVPARVARVGVLVDPDDAQVESIAPFVDVLQLHKVAPDRAAAIRARSGREIWAAVPVKTRGDLDAAVPYHGAADLIVYDAKTPDSAALPGGMGLRFDWALLDRF
ncbi:phosphoribosylanthranilate isomerase, partial [Sphingomonas sp.]|uniref:phosphoribosylanthranilate isomerase n=1 Tax=Sphingomonas sp. TaxID=28214 RepID=UPI002C42684F